MFFKMQSTLFIALLLCFFKGMGCMDNENSRLNYFDTDLLRYTAEGRKGNVMVSPASVKSCLSMILEGAYGNTSAEIQSALRLSPDKRDFREQLYKYLSFLKIMTPNTQLENVNLMFVSNRHKVNKEYAQMLRNVYFTDILTLDFGNPSAAADTINNWVSRSSKGLINAVIEPIHINPTSDAFMTNALYFKSTWKYAFDPTQTHGACFHSQGVCKTVAMMELHAELNYAFVDNLRSHAIELPYQDSKYSMILLVPLAHDGVDALVRDLPYMSVPQIYKLLQPNDVDLSMPKFTISYSEDLVGPLRNMRITTLFSTLANLSGIFEDDKTTQISNLFHEVQMSVDESGTVAAAATSAIIVPLIGQGVQLVVDRPFVFYIRDNEGGFVLFEGKIEDPTSFVEPSTPRRLKTSNISSVTTSAPQLAADTVHQTGGTQRALPSLRPAIKSGHTKHRANLRQSRASTPAPMGHQRQVPGSRMTGSQSLGRTRNVGTSTMTDSIMFPGGSTR